MKTAYWGLLAALIALALVAAACGGSEEPGAGEAAGTEAAPPEAPLPEGDCEADTEDAVATALTPLDEVTLGGDANFEGSAEVCGLELFGLEASGEGATATDARFFFTPTVLVGEPGQELTVRVTNAHVVAHTFTIEDQDIDEVIQPAAEPGETGESVEVKVTFPSDGQPVLFQCRFHRDQWGALVAL